MATVTDAPVLTSKKRSGSIESYLDEKFPEAVKDVDESVEEVRIVDLKAAALSDDVGDVFDNVRAIDLGADGKERPIGGSLSTGISSLSY